MLYLKETVRLKNLSPQMALAAPVVDGVYADFGIPKIVITSANDSAHSPKSLHYCREGKYTDEQCRALDFRTHYPELNGREQELRDEVKARLGPDFDVVLEDVGGPNEHLHVEYDPK